VHHELPANEGTVHGWFDRNRPPALTIEPGDSVTVDTLDAWWSAGPLAPGQDIPDRPRAAGWRPDAGHALTGPIAVRGASAGDTLAVRINAVTSGRWGTTHTGGPRRLFERYGIAGAHTVHRWKLDPDAGTGRNELGFRVALQPFLGIIGLAPAEPGRHSTIPPRRVGGNLDCRELVAGSTLYLPVEVDEALLSAGDGHAAQGDGEVGGTAIECPMRTAMTIALADLHVDAPLGNTPAGWITFGLATTVDEAGHLALNRLFDLMSAHYRLARGDAVALASVAAHLHVTQIVNQTVGVHALLPHGALRDIRGSRDGRR
jgi:acetamidase/formamidase